MHKEKLICSFCEKSHEEVKKMIAGPNVFICDECVLLCVEILNEEEIPETQTECKLENLVKEITEHNKHNES